MFMLKSTHRDIVASQSAGNALVIEAQYRQINALRAQLAETEERRAFVEAEATFLASWCDALTDELEQRQVPAVRDKTTGQFVKRGA